MKPGGGKQKGAQFEREVCQKLSLWVSGGSRKDLFWRSAMSGGRATVMLKKGDKAKTQTGDVSAIHSLGEKLINIFIIECKFYKDLEFRRLIVDNEGFTATEWKKLTKEAWKYDKLPFFIIKQNRVPILLGLSSFGLENAFNKKSREKLNYHLRASFPSLDLNLFKFDSFLSRISPKDLNRPLRER